MLLDLKIAYGSLSTHKFRTIMAIMGVLLGTLAFTGVQSMGQMMVKKAEAEVLKMGPNLFAIMAGQVRFHRSGGVSFRGDSKNLKVSDAQALKAGVSGVLAIAPMQQYSLPVRYGGTTVTGLVTATWPQYQRVRSFYVEHGRFFGQQDLEDKSKVVVLGATVADRLFGSPAAAMGKKIRIFRASFQVIGVMERKGRDLAGVDQDEQVFMPLTTYMRRASNTNHIKGVFMELDPAADMAGVRSAASTILRRRHSLTQGEPDDFSLLEARETIQLKTEALELMRTLGIIVSTISFGVGGMGILSIMVLMVRTRRREIGIRRAMGGTRKNIIRQFVLESAVMSLVGGGVGVVLCTVLVVCVSAFTDFPMVLDPVILGGALAGSVGLGLVAGAYPAKQAADIEILDVLTNG